MSDEWKAMSNEWKAMSNELLMRSLVKPHTSPSPSSSPLKGGERLQPSPLEGEGKGEGALLMNSLVTTGTRTGKTGAALLLCLAILLVCSFAGAEWKEVAGPRVWSFPPDHGSHEDYRTEWWYFTGNLRDGEGRQYGYQLTFFRQGLRMIPVDSSSPWSVRNLYLAHFTITDVSGGRFHVAERTSRTGPGLAGARDDGMDIRLLNWSTTMKNGAIFLEARNGANAVYLELVPRKPPVLHGTGGISRKGPDHGQGSYYSSLTDLGTSGWLKMGGTRIPVRGTSWFDHEFGSNQLRPDQAGWDWYGLHLSDGRDLMLYIIRKTDGSVEPASSGTLVEKDGTTRHLALSGVSVDILGHWKSPRSKAAYPSNWRIRVPSAGIDVTFSALIPDQELITTESTGIIYWEGAVLGKGKSGRVPINCEGYAEMTGYAGALGGMF